MPDITRTEYLEVNGVPLATPAWEVRDLSPLYDAPPVRGADRVVPYHEGVLPLRRIPAERRVQLPLVVYGDRDQEGAPYADARVGLLTNLDYLKRHVARPRQNATVTGVRTVKHHLPDGSVREADGLVIPPLEVAGFAPSAVNAVLDLLIPGAVLRSGTLTTATHGPVADGGSSTFVVSNAGTADQYEVVVELAGSASYVKLTSLTWDAAGDTFLEFTGTLGTLTTIDTGAFTADRDGVSVIGLVDHSGHERWLPLLPGSNTIRVEPTGGNVTATIKHYAPYL